MKKLRHTLKVEIEFEVVYCYGRVKKDEERRKGWAVDRRLNVVPSAKPVPVP